MYENICQENARLVHYFAKRYRAQTAQDYEDVVQAGFIGLMNAAQSFDHKAGAWSTWAGLHIRREMRQTVGLGGKQEPETLSIDTPIADGEDITLADMITDESLPELDAGILQDETARAVQEAVEAVENAAERAAIKSVYLDGLTASEAARRLDVNAQELYKLLRSGKAKIRKDKRLLKALPELDAETRFYAKKGITAFTRDHSSIVEDAVIWRAEKLREIVQK